MENKSLRPNEYKQILAGEPVTTYDNIHGNVTTNYYSANNEHIGYYVKDLNGRTKAYLFNQIETSARNTYHKNKVDMLVAEMEALKYDNPSEFGSYHNSAVDKCIEIVKSKLTV